MLHLWSDFRYAARRLGASPGFTAAAVLTIALGVGINTGIFSVLNGLMIRELPARDADELLNIHQIVTGDADRRTEGSGTGLFSTSEFRAYRDGAATLSGILGFSQTIGYSLGDTSPRQASMTHVTCNYFEVLGLPIALGPGFSAEHCTPGAEPTIVLSHEIWTSIFGADPDIVGRQIVLGARPFTVVGVAPERLRGLDIVPVSFFVPVSTHTELHDDDRTGWLTLIGRKAEEASLDQVRSELGIIAAQIDQERPPRQTRLVIQRARPLSDPEIQPIVFSVGAVIMAAFALVLLVACANVASLLLARAAGRNRELAVRLSLGATRGRIVQQVMTESVLIGGAGGLLGSALAIATFQTLFVLTLSKLQAPELLIETSPDFRVLSFALLLSLATGIACGLTPALRASRPDLITAMKVNAPVDARRASGGPQATLVGLQVAVCMVLVITAGLLLRGVYAVQAAEPGFAYEDISAAQFELPEAYDSERRLAFRSEIIERVGAQPGIAAVAQAAITPLSPSYRTREFRFSGGQQSFSARINGVSPSYFSLMGIPIVLGRTFTDEEMADGPAAVIVTESTARRLWPDENPLGRTLTMTMRDSRTGERLGDRSIQVVGVARDAEVVTIGEIPSMYMYLPAIPRNEPVLYLLARGRADYTATATAIRAATAEFDPRIVANIEPLEANFDLWRNLSAIVGTLTTSLGVLAVALASVGIYGVVAHVLSGRMREIGIRMALGASAASVQTLIVGRTMRPVVIGAILGIAAAVIVARGLSSVLFGVSPVDPVALIGAVVFVFGIALAAGMLPARRAARADPMRTLHCN